MAARRKKRRSPRLPLPDPLAGLIANLLTLAILFAPWALLSTDPDLYELAVMEDRPVEWATFLAFAAAAGFFGMAARGQRSRQQVLPWFLAGIALFCFVVAMEEISWGQRVFGYLPPAYFLEHNYQQELNLHNLAGSGIRVLAFEVILFGYGVAFPLLCLAGTIKRRLEVWAIVPPPLALVPAFLGSYIFYKAHPWLYTPEWVELTMGLGFLYAALAAAARWCWSEVPGASAQRIWAGAAWTGVVAGGFLLAAASDSLRARESGLVEVARAELVALQKDFYALESACGDRRNLSLRVYSYYRKFGTEPLSRGALAARVGNGMPAKRARFFLDPWNSPYWVQCRVYGDVRFDRVYSYGPNRRRDSTPVEVLGDDIAVPLGRAVR